MCAAQVRPWFAEAGPTAQMCSPLLVPEGLTAAWVWMGKRRQLNCKAVRCRAVRS